MKIKFYYPYKNGLQRQVFQDQEPVLIRGVLYWTGHIYIEPDNPVEKAKKLPRGVLCGAKLENSHDLPEFVNVSKRASRLFGVGICEDCLRIYKTLPTDENRKFAAWSRGL